VKSLTFRKRLKDGRHARLRISHYYRNTGEFAAVSLVAHHHRRFANDWLRKPNRSWRSKTIDDTNTGQGMEVMVWAAQCVSQSIPTLLRAGYSYLLIEATNQRRLELYKAILERRYGVITEPHEYEDRLMLQVDLRRCMIESFLQKMQMQERMPSEYSKILDDNFWDLT
jgi:hypothetical protein